MTNERPTPLTDAAEKKAEAQYETQRECGWTAFQRDGYDFARAALERTKK